MFSGIVRNLGIVNSITFNKSNVKLDILSNDFFNNSKLGDSVAVNGVCLTITDIKENIASFDLASETIRVTTLGNLKEGSFVHLEHSLKLGDSIDGHLVYGHVDTVTRILRIEIEANTWKFDFVTNDNIYKYIVKKGSIAIDGVSLTIGQVTSEFFSIYIIPHTYNTTLFSKYKINDLVNIEIDPISRYAVGALERLDG